MGVAFLTSCRGKLKIVAPPSMAVGENSEPVGVVGLAPCTLLFCSSSCSFSSLAIVIFSKSPLLKYFFPPYCKTNYTFQLISFHFINVLFCQFLSLSFLLFSQYLQSIHNNKNNANYMRGRIH